MLRLKKAGGKTKEPPPSTPQADLAGTEMRRARSMKYFFLPILLFVGLAACRSNVERAEEEWTAPSPDSFQIVPGQSVGLIDVMSTEYSLREAYGSGNVAIRPISLGEGWQEEGVVLFPGTKNELEIVWDMEAANGHPAFVRIARDSTRWRTAEGVTIGTPLWKLEQLNGAPFALKGFEWDLAGLVTDWNRGRFSEHLIVVLIPDNFEAMDEDLIGDVKLFSNDLRLRPLELKVGSIAVTFDGQK
jgi:hypothetical protein